MAIGTEGWKLPLSEADVKILESMTTDATISYAKLGEKLGLSSTAAHERVRKLKKEGIIKNTVAVLDYQKLDLSFLAFVQLKIAATDKKSQISALSRINEIEEVHSIAGEFSLLLKVRTKDTGHMEQVFEKIYDIPGVDQSQTIIVFSTYLDRPMQF